MKKFLLNSIYGFFTLAILPQLQAQVVNNNTALRIAELERDSAKVVKNIAELTSNKIEKDQLLLVEQKHFLNKTVKESKNFAEWSVLLELDKQIIDETLEYEKILDDNIIYKIVDITGKKIPLETLVQGEKQAYVLYIEIIKALTEHNAIKLQIFREEEVLKIIKEHLENFRK